MNTPEEILERMATGLYFSAFTPNGEDLPERTGPIGKLTKMSKEELIDFVWARYHGEIDNIVDGEQMEAFEEMLDEYLRLSLPDKVDVVPDQGKFHEGVLTGWNACLRQIESNAQVDELS